MPVQSVTPSSSSVTPMAPKGDAGSAWSAGQRFTAQGLPPASPVPPAREAFQGSLYGGTVTAQPGQVHSDGSVTWQVSWDAKDLGKGAAVSTEVRLREPFGEQHLAAGSVIRRRIDDALSEARRPSTSASDLGGGFSVGYALQERPATREERIGLALQRQASPGSVNTSAIYSRPLAGGQGPVHTVDRAVSVPLGGSGLSASILTKQENSGAQVPNNVEIIVPLARSERFSLNATAGVRSAGNLGALGVGMRWQVNDQLAVTGNVRQLTPLLSAQPGRTEIRADILYGQPGQFRAGLGATWNLQPDGRGAREVRASMSFDVGQTPVTAMVTQTARPGAADGVGYRLIVGDPNRTTVELRHDTNQGPAGMGESITQVRFSHRF